MAEFSIENVCNAIQAFNNGQANQVDAYLRSFSQSEQAWTVCLQILQSSPDPQYIFQLLRILKSKILYDFISLQPQQVTQIYQSSLQLVLHYGIMNQKSTRIQCVQILVYLYLYTYSQQTKTLLELLTSTFDCNVPNSPHQKFLYDALETLPEELTENKNLVMDENEKKRIAEDIKQKQMIGVIDYLQQQWIGATDKNLKFHILKSYKRWLEFIRSIVDDTEAAQFIHMSASSLLFKGALQSINIEELQNIAVEAICKFVGIIPKTICESPSIEPQTVAILFEEIFKSFNLCQKSLNEDSGDDVHYLIKLYTKVGKKFIYKILLNQQLENYLTTMLAIFCHENSISESEVLMDFWIRMIKTVRVMNDLTIQARFAKTFELLINGCVEKCKVKKELLYEYGVAAKIEDNFEQELEVRSQMKDILEELVTIIQPHMIIQHLGGILKAEFIGQMNEKGWIIFEACMYLISGIIKQIILKNDQIGIHYLMEIIKLYLDVQQQQQLANNCFIMKSVFKTIAQGCAQLISSNEVLLPALFNFITIGIHHSVSSVQKRAAKAFQMICSQNQNFVLQHINQFLDLIVKMQAVSNYDNLIKGVANAVCSSQETMQNYYLKLCSIFANNLVSLRTQFEEQLAGTKGNENLDQTIKLFCKNISSLAYINNQIPVNEAPEYLPIRTLVVNVYIELWPMLQYGMERISTYEPEIAEKTVRYTKYTFRKSFNSFSVELLTKVFTCFLNVYRQNPISACIYIAEVSATVFYKYPEYRTVLLEVFENLCNITFQHLPQLSSFEENPDLTEDFFGMLVRYGRYTPALIIQSQALQTILQLTLIAVGIEHVAAAKSFYSWLEVAFKMLMPQDDTFKSQLPQEYKDSFQPVIQQFIPQYNSKLFESLRKGPTDEEVEDYIDDCIIAISKLQFLDYQKLLESVLEEGPQNLLTKSEKQSILDNYKDAEKLREYLELYTRRSLQSKLRGVH